MRFPPEFGTAWAFLEARGAGLRCIWFKRAQTKAEARETSLYEWDRESYMWVSSWVAEQTYGIARSNCGAIVVT